MCARHTKFILKKLFFRIDLLLLLVHLKLCTINDISTTWTRTCAMRVALSLQWQYKKHSFEYFSEENNLIYFWNLKRHFIFKSSIDPSEIRFGHRLLNSGRNISDFLISLDVSLGLRVCRRCTRRVTGRCAWNGQCMSLFRFSREHGETVWASAAQSCGWCCRCWIFLCRFFRRHAVVIVVPALHFIVCLMN